MTFSDSRIVEALKRDWTPVWESVSPVKEVSFDLGEGREVKGTVGGEIAIYFCDERGQVFDILPALQSPAATLQAMGRALEFYTGQKGVMTSKAVRTYHVDQIRELVKDRPLRKSNAIDQYSADGVKLPVLEERNALDLYSVENVTDGIELSFDSNPTEDSFVEEMKKVEAAKLFRLSAEGEKKRDHSISEGADVATRYLREMAGSKVAFASLYYDSIMVVEPGGRGYYEWQVHLGFCGKDPSQRPGGLWDESLKQPRQWQRPLFTGILHQELGGGKFRYDSESLEAISIIED